MKRQAKQISGGGPNPSATSAAAKRLKTRQIKPVDKTDASETLLYAKEHKEKKQANKRK